LLVALMIEILCGVIRVCHRIPIVGICGLGLE
jgi:hypothetical protein